MSRFRRTLLRVLSFGLGLGVFVGAGRVRKGNRGQGEGRKEIGGKRGLVGGTVQGGENLGLEGRTKPCDGV